MSQLLRYVLISCITFAPMCATKDYRKLFMRDDNANTEMLISCVSATAERLFNDGNRIGVICYKCRNFENEIIRTFMEYRTTVVSNKPLPIKKRRPVSYVVFATKKFVESRRGLLRKGTNLHTVQYLFVSMAEREAVVAFADQLWSAGFRDIAFLISDNLRNATIQIPVMNGTIDLRPVGHCSPSGNDLDRIVPYSSNFYRFCAKDPCTLLYGSVTDDTIQFWREEDKLKISETEGYESMAAMLVGRFASFFNIETYYKENNLTWPRAAEKLINGELDMVIGLMPDNLEVLDGLEVVCWYRNRALTFSAQVRRRLRDYPVLQLLTPFHYSVWICTILTLLFYILLLCALKLLACMGLIKERLKFIQIYEVMLGQSVTYPRKTSLRAVLALWMIFSLNLSIIYNSTFTSSLTDLNTEDLLKNLKELRNSRMPLCGPRIVQQFLNYSDDPVIVDLRDRYKVMKHADEAFGAIMSNNTMGVVQHTTVDRLNWATRMDRNLRIYTLSNPVLRFPVLFFTRADHPYRVPFKRIVTEYRQSGMLYKWVKFYVIEEDKQIAASRENEDSDGGILTMKHVGPVFQLFFMCQAVSVLIFSIELFRFYILKIL